MVVINISPWFNCLGTCSLVCLPHPAGQTEWLQRPDHFLSRSYPTNISSSFFGYYVIQLNERVRDGAIIIYGGVGLWLLLSLVWCIEHSYRYTHHSLACYTEWDLICVSWSTCAVGMWPYFSPPTPLLSTYGDLFTYVLTTLHYYKWVCVNNTYISAVLIFKTNRSFSILSVELGVWISKTYLLKHFFSISKKDCIRGNISSECRDLVLPPIMLIVDLIVCIFEPMTLSLSSSYIGRCTHP